MGGNLGNFRYLGTGAFFFAMLARTAIGIELGKLRYKGKSTIESETT